MSSAKQVKAVFDALQSALDDVKERFLKEVDESSTEKKAQVEKDLDTAREWKKEGEMLIREVKDLVAQDDVSVMRSEHVLSPRIEGLLSTQPTMEPVQEIKAVIHNQLQGHLVKMFESILNIRGLFLFLLFS